MASITIIALMNIFASVTVADRAQGDAAAINIAGSLRLHSTRLGYLLQKKTIQVTNSEIDQQTKLISEKLHHKDLMHVLHYHQNDDVQNYYIQITNTWHEQIEPNIYNPNISRDTLRDFYDIQLIPMVNTIDKMVYQLQTDSETKIHILLAIQGASMFMTVMVIFIAMYKLNTSIVSPLRKLLDAAQRIRSGDFTANLEHEMDDELGQLADTFNQMTRELNRMYTDLEQKVSDKTAELTRSNLSLQLMYNTSRKLSASHYSHTTIDDITSELTLATGVKKVSLCLYTQPESTPSPLFFSEKEQEKRCGSTNCGECFLHALRQANFGIDIGDPSFPIRIKQNRFGILFVEKKPGQQLTPWQIDLFNAISDAIATTLSLEKKTENESRLMLAEERAAIARDLHDSLAQSLSYLKFQIGRWKILQSKEATQAQLDEVVNDVSDGLNSAYKQLRELLATFRLKLSDPGLEPALKGTVAEFSQLGNIDILLEYGIREIRLTPNEEIHLLQIIREALSNAVKHAQATQVVISITLSSDNKLILFIDDDGIGLPDNPLKHHHYGLSIMRERAAYLESSLLLGKSPQGGTRVYLEHRLQNPSTTIN